MVSAVYRKIPEGIIRSHLENILSFGERRLYLEEEIWSSAIQRKIRSPCTESETFIAVKNAASLVKNGNTYRSLLVLAIKNTDMIDTPLLSREKDLEAHHYCDQEQEFVESNSRDSFKTSRERHRYLKRITYPRYWWTRFEHFPRKTKLGALLGSWNRPSMV